MRSSLALLAAFLAAGASAQSTSYDYFMLVMQYAPSLCTDGTFKCSVSPSWSFFTLHGLWPERNDGSYPQSCTNEAFNASAIQPISAKMSKYWVSLNGPSTTFWEHE